MRVLTVLACVRTPDAARAVAVCADRLGGDPAVVPAVTKTVLLLGLSESGMVAAGAVRGQETGRAAVRVEPALAGHPVGHAASGVHASAVASAAGRRDRPNIAVGQAADRTSHPLDTRNGGPGFAGSRGVVPGTGPVEMAPVAARGALASVGATTRSGGASLPTLVPQQRVELAAAGAPRPPSLTERGRLGPRGIADGQGKADT